ncbi:MAG: hypothetical protein IKG15_11100 [Solobacterium sp.]|nr:hypothetical protein [Solobacterium sp.]
MTKKTMMIIAAVTMLVDHAGLVFFNNMPLMRGIGRISFPLYAFMIADGYAHVKEDPERLRFYLLRLILLALISELPYDNAFYGGFPNWDHQNVIFTLLLGFAALAVCGHFHLPVYCRIPAALAAGWIAELCHTSYGLEGVIFIMAFSFLIDFQPKEKTVRIILGTAVIWLFFIFSYTNMDPFRYGIRSLYFMFANNPWRLTVFSVPLILAFYEGKKGNQPQWFHLCYRLFYPVHLALIWVVSLLIQH